MQHLFTEQELQELSKLGTPTIISRHVVSVNIPGHGSHLIKQFFVDKDVDQNEKATYIAYTHDNVRAEHLNETESIVAAYLQLLDRVREAKDEDINWLVSERHRVLCRTLIPRPVKENWLKAALFAKAAHAAIKHIRKYTQEPYFVHLKEVHAILQDTIPDILTDAMISAAYLHDTIEDTGVVYEDILESFGLEIADLVWALTDVSKPEDGNRKIRKAKDRAHYVKSIPAAANIKLADLISNTRSIVRFDRNFAKVYVKEKEELLKVLHHADARMLAYAYAELAIAKEALIKA